MSNAPTLINLPPPPSDPVTPSDVPSRSGTPNSTTTSMSELSTVAIKDGHRGHLPHHSSHATSHTSSGLSHQLDAERADRISRLAGLERVTTARNPPQTPTNLTPGATAPPFGTGAAGYGSGSGGFPPGSAASNLGPGGMATSYFDAQGNPTLGRERSTVGSASATGSVGARTTWAGDSEIDTADAESMDLDATSSVGGESEAGRAASLVGFGEGARTPARQSVISSPGGVLGGKAGAGGVSRDPRAMEGLSFEGSEPVGDVTNRGASAATSPSMSEQAERIVRENMDTTSADRMRRGQGPGDLGKFGFEK